jgi:tetratricopeptide (TPR) repeat protein/tRNA A-37 threonylcarbamoyl transferase component Bud32
MTPENDDILEPNTGLFGYRVLEFVSEGTWAYVYKAQHPKLPMLVAIKQLKPEWAEDEDALQRFLREANIVAQLQHPNVVRIYDLKHDEETGLHYIITEFAEKGTLADRLEKSPEGLPIDEVLHLAMGICSGLEAVHRRGLVHRDIKPNNILLCDVGGGRDVPKLSDFGIAKVPVIAGVEPPESTGIYGLIYYMSPEQLDSEIEIDHRSDLYSLGVLLYELLTRQVPFTGEPDEVFWAHMYVSPKSPRELRPGIPEALEQIVLRALRKDREERYQSAADMHEALKAIVDVPIRKERQRKFKVLLEQGLAYLDKEDWEAAIEVLLQADVLEPGDERVLEGLQEAREQQGLKRLYDRGVQCWEEGNWGEAQEYLAQVIGYDLDYAGGQAGELLEQATQALEREQRRRGLMVQYQTGMGHFRKRQWAQAIAELQWVVAEDREFEDAASRLAEARQYVRAEELFEQAQRHKEREEWEKVVDLLEEVEQLGPPHINVTEELKHARKKRIEARGERQLAAWYDEGVAQLAAGNLDQARVNFERVYERRPGYRDVADRLREIQKQLNLKQFFERASEFEAACNWEGAVAAYRDILDIDSHNSRAASRLARALRRAERGDRGGLVGIGVKAQEWWDERDRRAKAAWMGLFGLIVLALCLVSPQARGLFPLLLQTATPAESLVALTVTSPVPPTTTTLTPMPSLMTSNSTTISTPTIMSTKTPLPTLAPTDTPMPTSTYTPTPARVVPATPIPRTYPSPELQGLDIMGCNVTFKWDWPGTLAEDEWFAVRAWREGIDPHDSVAWVKERRYTHVLSNEGEYSWEIAICRGDPGTHICEKLAVSGRESFVFLGCGGGPPPPPPPPGP